MRDVVQTEELDIPEGVTVEIKSRLVTVTGPRGTLKKNVRHINMDIQLLKDSKRNKVTLAVWAGGRKHIACLRTIRSLINNLVIGVTKVRPNDLVLFAIIADCLYAFRASSTRCVRCMPISRSTASSRMVVPRWRSAISLARRYDFGSDVSPLALMASADCASRNDARGCHHLRVEGPEG